MTINQLREAYKNGDAVTIAFMGDSTTGGFGCNGGANSWAVDGIPHGSENQPTHGYNWEVASPYYINLTGFPSQAQQDNVAIPSAVRLFRTEAERRNPSSVVYNYGGSGYATSDHVSGGTVATIAALVPKPDAVVINLGINDAKNNLSVTANLTTLINSIVANGMLPILVKPNNIGVANDPTGTWTAASTPAEWCRMDNWQSVRDEIQAVADTFGLDPIDLGEDNGDLNSKMLYDSFHPTDIGYEKIFSIYNGYLSGSEVGAIGEGAIRVKTNTNKVIALKSDEEKSVEEIPLKLSLNKEEIIKGNNSFIKSQNTAWVLFDATTTPPTIKDSYGVTSVARLAAGNHRITVRAGFDLTRASIDLSRNSTINQNACVWEYATSGVRTATTVDIALGTVGRPGVHSEILSDLGATYVSVGIKGGR